MNVKAGEPIRFLCFDVENRPSAYWFDGRPTAELTAIGWKWRDEDDAHALVLTRSGRWRYDDQARLVSPVKALTIFRTVLCSAGVVYGHNIRRHDLGLIQSALKRVLLESLPPLRTWDTLRDFPKGKDMSASLENLAKVFELGADKKHMGVADWEKANRLEPDGILEARDRVVSDVLLQEKLRDRLVADGVTPMPRWWRP